MNRGYTIKKILVVYLPILAFGLFMIVWMTTVFLEPKKDVTVFLSVGFAMLIALASVCFSWVKTIDEKDQKTIREIKICGESFLLSAIVIVVAIALKYVSLTLEERKGIIGLMGTVSYYIFYLICLTVNIYFIVAYSKLLDILFSRVDTNIRDL